MHIVEMLSLAFRAIFFSFCFSEKFIDAATRHTVDGRDREFRNDSSIVSGARKNKKPHRNAINYNHRSSFKMFGVCFVLAVCSPNARSLWLTVAVGTSAAAATAAAALGIHSNAIFH